MTDLPKRGDVFLHWKDDSLVVAQQLAQHHDTGVTHVVYIHGGKSWIRPLDEWYDKEPKMGGKTRFRRVPVAAKRVPVVRSSFVQVWPP